MEKVLYELARAFCLLPCCFRTRRSHRIRSDKAVPRPRVLLNACRAGSRGFLLCRGSVRIFQAIAKRDQFEFKGDLKLGRYESDRAPRTTQVVMWLDEFPSTPAQRKAFEEYMEHGGELDGFSHCRAGTENRAMWLPEILGFFGYCVRLATAGLALPATLTVDSPNHPAVKGLPASFVSPDNEWYSWEPSHCEAIRISRF